MMCDMVQPDGEDEIVYHGRYVPMPPTDPPGWVDGTPTSGRDQSCAFCGDPEVAWVHPLASERVGYRVYGKGHTLPSFWTLCDRCEHVYAGGDEEAAVRLMTGCERWPSDSAQDVDELIRKPLRVFRRSDRGARRLLD